jgi:glycerol-3-phosphate dehydrogenase
VLFAVPWQGKLLLGTTDTLREKAELEPQALDQEIDFILSTAAGYLVKKPSRHDILSVFAGLRPLAAHQGNPKATKDISRNFKVILSESQLVTVTGGKWTIYRKMAEATLDKLIQAKLLPYSPCTTATSPIRGHTNTISESSHLEVYGTDAAAIKQLQQQMPELATKAEVVWVIRYEMARTVEDVLARRLRLLFLDAVAAMEAAPAVAAILAGELKQSDAWADEQVRSFIKLAHAYTLQPAHEAQQI